MTWIRRPAPPGHLQTVGTPEDWPAEWRWAAEWHLCSVPLVDPGAALWVEAVLDVFMECVVGQDRIEQMYARPPDQAAWTHDVRQYVAARLRVTGLLDAGATLGVDVYTGHLAEGAVNIIHAASAGRVEQLDTWETDLIRHTLWWREQLYIAVAEATGREGE